jgi:hypothetical protein
MPAMHHLDSPEQYGTDVSTLDRESDETREDRALSDALPPLTALPNLPSSATDGPDGVVESERPERIAATSHPSAGNGLDTHTADAVPHTIATVPAASSSHAVGPAAAEARGLLEGIAESLRTLAGRQGTDGAAVAIFPRGVDLLEVRMHVARDQAIDLNFRVAGPAQASLNA